MYIQKYPHLFKPLEIRGQIIRNRIMSAPNMLFHTVDGRPTDYYVRYLEHKARGGAGIVTLGEANVVDGGNHTPGMEPTWDNLPIYAEMSQAIRENGALAAVELTHGGSRVKPQYNKDQTKLMGPSHFVNPMTGAEIREMTEADMEYVINGYCDTAAFYQLAGFDILHIHAGHSWLLEQFLSPFVNTRTDEYGGTLENRMRFPLRVFKAIRERVGDKIILSARISGSERTEGGFTPEDMARFIEKAQEYIDFAEISSEDFVYTFGSTFLPRGQNVELAERIMKTGLAKIPIFTIGSIMTPAQAEEILAKGQADGVAMSRALIADPYLPYKTLAGREDTITPCLRCLNCTDSDNAGKHFICSVNPLIAREERLGFGEDVRRANHPRRVLVIGGGPAGMKAALTAAELGHEVTLAEKTGTLGGLIKFSDYDMHKQDLRDYKNYLIRSIKNTSIKVLLNTEAEADLTEVIKPSDIIIAAGAHPIIPRIKGIEKARHASEVFFDKEHDIGRRVVIIGGGLVGVETGLYLRELGREVTVLEALPEHSRDALTVYKMGLMRKIEELKLHIKTNTAASEISDAGVVTADGVIPADLVLFAVGMTPNRNVFYDMYDKAPFVRLAGDAKFPGKVDAAVHSGFFAALEIGRY